MLIQIDQIPLDGFKYRTANPVPVLEFQQLQRINRLGMSKVQDSIMKPPTSFSEFLIGQADWVQQLLEDHELVGVSTESDILKEHDEVGGLLIVSNGSVRRHNMSYGWVVANGTTRTILVQGSGPGFG